MIQNLPLPDIISHSDLYKLRNDIAIQLLNASGVFPLPNSVYIHLTSHYAVYVQIH